MSRREELKDLIKELIEEVMFEILEDEDCDVEFDGPLGTVESCNVKDGVLTANVRVINDGLWRVFKQEFEKHNKEG